jgi:hypothetical protein
VRIRALLLGTVLGLTSVVGATAPAQASTGTHGDAVVSIVHAVPKVPVDVYVNHHRLLNDFQPGTVAGPLKLRHGTYTVSITAATAKNDAHPVIGPVRLTFKSHRDYSVVAHLTAAGQPTATLYMNDVHRVGCGTGRLIVRHDAAAPAVDVLANGHRIVRSLTNPHQAKLVVPARTYSVRVNLAGTSTTAIGPAAVKVEAHSDTIVYAWGSAAKGDLMVLVQRIPLRH